VSPGEQATGLPLLPTSTIVCASLSASTACPLCRWDPHPAAAATLLLQEDCADPHRHHLPRAHDIR
jgi:hypothetical protein